MTTTDTERLDFGKPDVGTEDNAWGALLNTIFDEIDKRTAGVTSITLSGAKTLTNSEYLHPIIEFTGNPGGDVDVTFPDVEGFWWVKDGTTGGHTIGCTISGGTPLDLTAGLWTYIYTAGSSADVARIDPSTGLADLVEDTTPQLGGDLDVNGNTIQSVGNANVDINANGTGAVNLGGGGNVEVDITDDGLRIGGSGDRVTGIATADQFRDDTAKKLLTGERVWDAAAEVTLTDATTIAVDMSTFINAKVTLAGNRTLGNPTNEKVGQSGVIRVIQDGTGNRTLAYGTDWEFAGGSAPTLSTGANDEDLLFYHVIAADRVFAQLVNDIS